MNSRAAANPAVTRLADDYSASAGLYARHWGPVILPMALPLLDRLPIREAERILDIGTGAGGLLEPLRHRAPRALICGVDRAVGMLEVAARRRGGRLACMDAAALGLAADAFDLVTMAFMLFHLEDPAEGLKEAARVLRPGGGIGLTTWAVDPGLPGLHLWNEELDRAGAAPDPRDDSVRQHHRVDTPQKVRRLLEEAGFEEPAIWTLPVEREFGREDLLTLHQFCGAPGRRLDSLSPSDRAACVERMRRGAGGARPEDRLWRAEVLLAVAKRAARRGSVA